MTLRKLLFWTHLTCGAIAGVVILIMSVTGVLLTYQRQITAWADMRAYHAGPPAAGAARLPVSALAAAATATSRGDGPATVTVRSDADAPASVSIGPRTIFVNAYTGEILGEGAPGVRAFFRRVTDWHRWLGASENRATGRTITGVSNLAFLVIVASGPFLWWPKTFTRKQVRAIAWFKGGLPSKARDFNWHNTIGVWSVIPLVVIVASGVVISYPWASNLVYRLAGEEPPAARGAGGPRGNAASEQVSADRGPDLDIVALAAAERPAWRTIAVRVPQSARGPLAATVDEGSGGQPQKRGTLTFDPQSGAVVGWESQAGASAGRRARSWLRFAHTGEVYGIAGQTVAGIASLGGVILVWTGLALSIRRLASWWARKRRRLDGTVREANDSSPRLASEQT